LARVAHHLDDFGMGLGSQPSNSSVIDWRRAEVSFSMAWCPAAVRTNLPPSGHSTRLEHPGRDSTYRSAGSQMLGIDLQARGHIVDGWRSGRSASR
jgi:hypothetical protein